MLNKILSYALLASILATGCFAASLTTVHASVTITFGHKPAVVIDPKVVALSMALPASLLKRY